MIDVLVVDDSALMRRFLGQIFTDAGGFNVRLARNGAAALEAMAEQLPDVVTLDINMPEMDGLTCLSHIMTRHPCPVIMVSSLTEKGALSTLEALELGAVDYLTKPGGTVSHNISQVADELVAKVRSAASSAVRIRPQTTPATTPVAKPVPQSAEKAAAGLVLVGVSTGGPGALETVLADLPADLGWPVVIAQHMPATFTAVLAKRLNGLCVLNVQEVSRPTPLKTGNIYMAQGDRDLEIRRRGGRLIAVPVPADNDLPWHPSTDRLVRSAMAELTPDALVGILLTGMGDDGAAAMAELHRQGGQTIAESEDTTVVFGMPRALIELDGADRVLPLEQIGRQVTQWVPSR